MILARGERQDVRPIDHHDEACLLAGEKILDDQACARFAERVAAEHRVDGGMRLFRALRDDDALAGGQAIRLDDDRCAVRVDVRVRRPRIGERAVSGGRNAVPRHESLGVILRRLELRGRAGRSEDPQARGPEVIDDPGRERRLGPDDRQRNGLALRKIDQLTRVRDRNVGKRRVVRRAGVPGRDIDAGHARRLREPPRERVLAPAAADHQDVHRRRAPPVSSTRNARRYTAYRRD